MLNEERTTRTPQIQPNKISCYKRTPRILAHPVGGQFRARDYPSVYLLSVNDNFCNSFLPCPQTDVNCVHKNQDRSIICWRAIIKHVCACIDSRQMDEVCFKQQYQVERRNCLLLCKWDDCSIQLDRQTDRHDQFICRKRPGLLKISKNNIKTVFSHHSYSHQRQGVQTETVIPRTKQMDSYSAPEISLPPFSF